MREVDRALKLDPTNTELLTQKTQILAKQLENAKDKLKTLKDVQEQVKQQFKNGEIGEEAYRAFQREVAVAESNVNKLESELKSTDKTMKTTADDAGRLSDGVEDIGESAEGSESKLEKFCTAAKKLGKMAAVSIAAIGTAAVASAKKLWDMSNDTAAAGDNIDKISQKIGISAEAYQEWDYVFERCGADVNNLQAGMKKLSGVITEAEKGSEKAKEKLAAVGLTIDDLNGKSQDEQLSIVITALQGMEQGAQRTAAANALLGKSATDMAAVLNAGADATQELKDEAHEYGMVMDNEAVAASAAFADSLTKLKRTVAGAKNNIIGELLPGITQLMDGFSDLAKGGKDADEKIKQGITDIIKTITDVIPSFTEFIGNISEAVITNAPAIITALADGLIQALPQLAPAVASVTGQLISSLVMLLPQFAQSIISVITQLIQSIAELLPTLTPQLTTALVQILQVLIDNLPLLLKAGLELVKGLIQGIIEAIPVLIDALPDLITSIVDFVLDSIPQIIDTGIQLLTALVDALPEIIQQIVDVIPEIITGIIDALTDNLPLIVQAGIDLFVALVNDLPKIITAIVEAIPKIIDKVIDAVIDSIPQLIDAGIKLFVALVDNLPAIIEGIISAAPKIISALISAFIKLIPKLIEAGIKLFSAIVQNMPQIIQNIVSKIPEIIQNIVKAFGNLIGEMADIGKRMIEGLWDGIKSMTGWLGDRCKDFGNTWMSGFKSIFGIHSPSKLFRDEIGKNLALGLGIGFTDGMEKVTKDMQNAIPTSFDIDPAMNINGINRKASELGRTVSNVDQRIVFSFNVENFTNHSDKDLRELMDYAGRYFAAQVQRRENVF